MKNIAIIGECMLELSGKSFGNMKQSYGGDSLNTATYLARLTKSDEVKVHYITALGTDHLSTKMIEYWNDDSINTDYVMLDPNRFPGIYLIQLDDHGERSFLYWRNNSAARYMVSHPQYPQIIQGLKNMDIIYLSGASLAILPPDDCDILINDLIKCSQNGAEIIFDSNFRPKLWENFDQTRTKYNKILSHTNIALVTFDDEKALWQDQTPEHSIERLQQSGVKNVVVKNGSEGAILKQHNNDKIIKIPTKKIDKVIDTTGAGDSFNAGFIAGYVNQKDFATCCQQGNQTAGLIIQHYGSIVDKNITSDLFNLFNY